MPEVISIVANTNSVKTLPLRALRVFLCHSSGDKPAVRKLYERLSSSGVSPWMDEENLLPGQDWDLEISKAVRNSDVVVVCLSRGSTTKAGYVQREIKVALDIADEQPEGTIFLIPLRLEQCSVPVRLQRLHWVDIFNERGYELLMRSLRARADQNKQEYLFDCSLIEKGSAKEKVPCRADHRKDHRADHRADHRSIWS